MKPHPKISLDCLEASRLYFTNGAIYDSRGYEFARYPETGTYKDKERVDCNVFFGAYDDGDGDFFSFCDADCFDPPQYLIRASSFSDAYDIYIDEFASVPDDAHMEDIIDDLLEELVGTCIKEGSIMRPEVSIKEWLAALPAAERDALREKAMDNLGNDGDVAFAPNGARIGDASKWGHLRCTDTVHGTQLALLRIEGVTQR